MSYHFKNKKDLITKLFKMGNIINLNLLSFGSFQFFWVVFLISNILNKLQIPLINHNIISDNFIIKGNYEFCLSYNRIIQKLLSILNKLAAKNFYMESWGNSFKIKEKKDLFFILIIEQVNITEILFKSKRQYSFYIAE